MYHRIVDSPFQSPPSVGKVNRRTPQPLVLDPAASRQEHNHRVRQNQTLLNGEQQPLAQKILQVATGRIRDQLAVMPSSDHNLGVHSTPAVTHSGESAASFARYAPKAGYLQKLGRNIPEFKRRFFVLQTETNLYYYLSPNDIEPRGKISLEGTRLEEVERLPDGRFRFAILQDDARIVLEARSDQAGIDWMQQLEEQRVSTLKQQVDQLSNQVQRQNFQIGELEQQVENFKLVEKDRDGALEDAQQWKAQFERLDEALRLLTQRMRQPPEVSKKLKGIIPLAEGYYEEEKKETDTPVSWDELVNLSIDGTPVKNNQSSKKRLKNSDNDLPSNLLDNAFHAVDDKAPSPLEDIEEMMNVPGTYFSSLADACQQQRDALKLAAEEAATAVEDVHEADAQVKEMTTRMERAEKHLTKLWEENCAIRKTLKQTKREKRVLVREYKLLKQGYEELDQKIKMAAPRPSSVLSKKRGPSMVGKENKYTRPLEDTLLGSDEERLIDELEEHVALSIKLHERLLKAGDFLNLDSDTELNTSVENTGAFDDATGYDTRVLTGTATDRKLEETENAPPTVSCTPASASSGMTCLMDDDDTEESADEANEPHIENEDDGVSVNEYQSIMSPSVVSSVGADLGSVTEFSQNSSLPALPTASTDSSPERPNPALTLDRDDSTELFDRQMRLGFRPAESRTSKPNVTDYGQPTSRLSCPLADVVEPKGYALTDSTRDTGIYHLTFYSKKIGIQFQKAPTAPIKPKGLLTAAMTADLNPDMDDSLKTAAELRNISTLSSLATGRNVNGEEVCPVALPKDVVLVCGFQGFDESSNNKPKLGARLVAFDGVSVEIGPWTFDAIRKAIQSRGRPLTLSFRNDYLTTEQRGVLTKAVMEVDAKRPPIRPDVDVGFRPLSTTPSLSSVLSHDTDYSANDDESGKFESGHIQDLSTWAQDKDCCHGKLASSSHSLKSRLRRLSGGSHSTHQGSFRSFSDAGSSISSSFAPLVASLVKQASDRQRKDTDTKKHFAPQYLRRAAPTTTSLENSPQHQDFQSNLL